MPVLRRIFCLITDRQRVAKSLIHERFWPQVSASHTPRAGAIQGKTTEKGIKRPGYKNRAGGN